MRILNCGRLTNNITGVCFVLLPGHRSEYISTTMFEEALAACAGDSLSSFVLDGDCSKEATGLV